MTDIDPARLKANTPTAKRRRWLAQHLTAWILAVVLIGGPIILINQIERLFT